LQNQDDEILSNSDGGFYSSSMSNVAADIRDSHVWEKPIPKKIKKVKKKKIKEPPLPIELQVNGDQFLK
jgi:hypothetical protein